MEENGKKVSRTGLGLSGILTIIFVLAKIFDKIDWSWWWVFSPLWIPAGIVTVCTILAVLIAFIAALLDD